MKRQQTASNEAFQRSTSTVPKRCLRWAWPGDRAGHRGSCSATKQELTPAPRAAPQPSRARCRPPGAGAAGVAPHRWDRPVSPEGSGAGQSLPDPSSCPSAAWSHPQVSPLVAGLRGRTAPPRSPQRAPGPRPLLGARSRGRETGPAFPRPGLERGLRRSPGLVLAGAL